MIKIIDFNIKKDPQPRQTEKKRKDFLIVAKAYSLGILDTEGTLADLMAIEYTDRMIDSLIVKIAIQEGPSVKYTI